MQLFYQLQGRFPVLKERSLSIPLPKAEARSGAGLKFPSDAGQNYYPSYAPVKSSPPPALPRPFIQPVAQHAAHPPGHIKSPGL